MDQWQVLLKDHHVAYISWERYLENQQMLNSNRTRSHPTSCGAAREGSALLAGLLRCARCGHKLHVAYRGREGRAPRYYCLTGNIEQGKPSCLCFGGFKADQAVVDAVLEVCQPIGIEASLEVLKGSQAEEDRKRRALELAVERARYESERVRRQYDAVDPANRLVGAELEARWNTSLVQLAEAEARLKAEENAQVPLTEEQKKRLLALGSDLPALWNDPAAPVELKKRILRTVISEIIVDVNHASGQIEMRIHWAGGVHTKLAVRKNQAGRTANATDKDVVELVRELAKAWPDSYIAGVLNRSGYQTGPGNAWNETRVKNLRIYNKIPVFTKGCERAWLTMAECANELNVNVGVIRTMVKHRLLAASQHAKGAPWMIQRDDLNRAEVQHYTKAAHTGKPALRREDNHIILLDL
jgi:recombinase-like zinc beta ribbon protein